MLPRLEVYWTDTIPELGRMAWRVGFFYHGRGFGSLPFGRKKDAEMAREALEKTDLISRIVERLDDGESFQDLKEEAKRIMLEALQW